MFFCWFIDSPVLTEAYQLCEDTGCSLEDLPREMADIERWQEREWREFMPSEQIDELWDICN